MGSTAKAFFWIIVVAILAMAGYALYRGANFASTDTIAADEAAASTTVVQFGAQFQKVSLLASDASTTIASTYAQYVDPNLLAQWKADPQSAPGRVTSSPWPDRVEIVSVTPQGQGYVVQGLLVWMTSDEVMHGGNAGTTPVVIQLAKENGVWVIVAYQEQVAKQE